MEHLKNSGLVQKHEFGYHMVKYEKSFLSKKRDGVIFTDTGAVLEFTESRIQNIMGTIQEVSNINTDKRTQYFCSFRNQIVKTE